MKSAKPVAVVLLFISFSLTNCSPDHEYLFTTNEIITRGSWGVEFFCHADKTATYGKYTFQFNGNGTLQGTNGIILQQGKWDVIRDAARADVLTINMSEQNNVYELSNVWDVKAKSTQAFTFQAKGNNTEFRLRKL